MATTPISGIGNVQILLQGVSSGGSAGGATSVPPGILALPSGTLLRGQVVQVESHGLAVLRTPKGDLTLKTDLALKRGSEVIIRLDTALSDIRAKIISVDGLTPREYQQTTAGKTPQPAALTVEDVIDLPNQPLSATKLPAQATRQEISSGSTQPAPQQPVADSVDIASPQPVLLRAVLLSRAADLPQLLTQLPASVFISPQRLDSGAAIAVTLLPDSVQLPGNTSAPPSSIPAASGTIPSAAVHTAATPATPVSTPASSITTPAPLPVNTPQTSVPTANTQASLTSSGTTQQSATPPSVAATPSAASTTGQTAGPAATVLPASPSVTSPAPTIAGGNAPAASPASIPSLPATPPAITTSAITPATVAIPPPAAPHTPVTAVTSSPVITPEMLTIPIPTSAAATEITPQPAALIRQGIIQAQVIGTEQSGETVLKTPLGIIKLDLYAPNGQRLTLPPETTLQLQLQSLQAANIPLPESPVTNTSPAGLTDLTQQWQSLRDMMAILQQQHPLLAQEIIQNIIPKPGATLARDVLFFLLALKSGSLEEWTGKRPLEALEQSLRGDLARKSSAEFGTLRQYFMESPSPHWQTAFVPVHHEGEWQQMRLFIKKEKPKSSVDQGDPVGTRFIVEVDFSRLGPMQFDGFVKKQSQSTHFDLVIRSTQTLADDDQQAIRRIFGEASEITGFRGGLNFQTGQPFPVLPLEEVLKSDRNVIA